MNFFRIAIILLFIIATFVTVKIHPSVHNPMIIENEDFKLTRISDDLKPIPVVSNPEQTKTVQISEPAADNELSYSNEKTIAYDAPNQSQTKYIQTEEVKPQSKNVKIHEQQVPDDNSQVELLRQILQGLEDEIQQEAEQKPKVVENKTKPEPKNEKVTKDKQEVKQPENPVKTQPPKSSSNPYMTEEEEIIAWNVWRSNVHNQIMKDSDIGDSFVGTIFSFSFVVDKFGNVSNIKVEAFPPHFMDVARKGVKPAIAGLQNKPILNFPRGTKRTSTVVEGKFAVGTSDRFSTPGEYSDYERVMH